MRLHLLESSCHNNLHCLNLHCSAEFPMLPKVLSNTRTAEWKQTVPSNRNLSTCAAELHDVLLGVLYAWSVNFSVLH